MKAILVATLFVFSMAAVAGGGTQRKQAPDDNWLGASNTDDTARTLMITCPADTMPDGIEAEYDDEGVAIVVKCINTGT